jgi:hypothetical protein
MNRFRPNEADAPRLLARAFLAAAFPLLIVGALGSVFGATGGAQVGGPYGGPYGGPGGGSPAATVAPSTGSTPQAVAGAIQQEVSQPAATSGGGAPTPRVVDLALTGSNTTTALMLAGAFLLVGGLLVRASDSSRPLALAGFPRGAAASADPEPVTVPAPARLYPPGPLDPYSERVRLDQLAARISLHRALIESTP